MSTPKKLFRLQQVSCTSFPSLVQNKAKWLLFIISEYSDHELDLSLFAYCVYYCQYTSSLLAVAYTNCLVILFNLGIQSTVRSLEQRRPANMVIRCYVIVFKNITTNNCLYAPRKITSCPQFSMSATFRRLRVLAQSLWVLYNTEQANQPIAVLASFFLSYLCLNCLLSREKKLQRHPTFQQPSQASVLTVQIISRHLHS